MIHTTWNNRSRYLQMHPRFSAAFSALEAAAARPFVAGRHDVLGNELFLVALDYATKPQEEGTIEGHRSFVDIMYILEGEERIDYMPIRDIAHVVKEYEAEGDYYLAELNPAASGIRASAGDVLIFFPEDGHAPGLNWCTTQNVKKLIAKVLL